MEYPHFLTARQQQVVTVLEEQDRRERRTLDRASLRVRAVSRDVAQFLYLMALRDRARTLVELGTSAGFSTIHLAAAARRTGGHVLSVDRDAEKTAWARRNLEAAGVDDLVELHTGEAADFARDLAPGLDLLFIDLGVASLLPQLPGLKEKVAAQGLVFADGYGTSETSPEWQELIRSFAEDPRFALWMMPMHKVHLVALRV
ncbi:MAG: class I SAM-dependent methyltransferase [Candidatus Latescibacterota bacterium]